MAGTTCWLQIKVLAWKNIILHKRYWFLIIFELLNPALFLILVGLMQCSVSSYRESTVCKNCEYGNLSPAYNVFDRFDKSFHIFYCPNTTFVNVIMNITGELLHTQATGFNNEDQLNNYIKSTHNNKEIFVRFFDNNVENPKKIRYLIALSYGYICNWLRNDRQFFRKISKLDIYSKMDIDFYPLQLAIDTTFMKYHDVEDSFNIELRSMPIPYKDNYLNIIKFWFPPFTVWGFQCIYVSILHRIVDEKQSGIQELMKMMGMRSWILWLGWFIYVVTASIIAILFATVGLHIWKCPFIKYSNVFILYIFLFLYAIAGSLFCFAVSSFCSRPIKATIIGLILSIFTYIIPDKILLKLTNPQTITVTTLFLLPNAVVFFGFDIISRFEDEKVGVQWENIFQTRTLVCGNLSMFSIFGIFIAEGVIYIILTLYVEKMFPGPYGISKPFHYPLTNLKNYVFSKSNKINYEAESHQYQSKIEEVSFAPVGIHIMNLTKDYGKNIALDNVSLSMYYGEITILSGANGAGKSTLMSILNGTIGPTSGTATILGKNINSSMNIIRKDLGVCSQFNFQFPLLTVLEHFMFFGMLKGLSHTKSHFEAVILLDRLNLYEVKNCLAYTLSNGLKRRLSVGMALISNPKVLMLDEPTSGLDPDSRRVIWDMLLSVKGNRMILLSTHDMEEADVVGDRIAVLNGGRLICYGTPTFLKKEFGSGYHLEIMYDESNGKNETRRSSKEIYRDAEKIGRLVTDAVPSAYLQSHFEENLVFILPHETKSHFSKLFEALEQSKNILQITKIRLSVTTLDEIFLRVGDFISKGRLTYAGIDDIRKKMSNPIPRTLTGYKRFRVQIKALCIKQYWIEKLKWKLTLLQITILLCTVLLLLYITKTNKNCTYVFQRSDFTLPKFNKHVVYYSAENCFNTSQRFIEHYKELALKYTPYVHLVKNLTVALKKSKRALKYISVGAQFICANTTFLTAKALYFAKRTSSAPISLNLLTNTILQVNTDGNFSIEGSVQYPHISTCSVQIANDFELAAYWAAIFPLGLLLYSAFFLIYPISEKISDSKTLQLMSGVHFLLYWGIFYVWNMFMYILGIIIIGVTIVLYEYRSPVLFDNVDDYSKFFIILFAYGHSIILLSFLYSHKTTNKRFFSFVAYMISICYVMVIFTLFFIIIAGKKNKFLVWICNFNPQFGLMYTIYVFIKRLLLEQNSIFIKFCHSGDIPTSSSVLIMYASSILFFIILVSLESHVMRKWTSDLMISLKNKINVQVEFRNREHNDVLEEAKRVALIFNLEKRKPEKMISAYKYKLVPDMLLVKGIQKNYGSASLIKNISFGVQMGDCFGLLGTNGSGKTTLLRILTGNLPLTKGDARIFYDNKFLYLSKNCREYLNVIGYCPQNDANLNSLTGYQNLYFYAKLRGVASDVIKKEVNMWLKLFGLDGCANQSCKYYSRGNKRKLCLATALVGSPSLLFLDEPTMRVDPVSRRKVVEIINIIQHQEIKPSIILTSQSMNECEALCNRLAIMEDGQFECLGSLSQLKKKFGEGYTIILKLRIRPTHYKKRILAEDQNILRYYEDQDIVDVMTDFETMYSGLCSLENKHNVLLHYHLLARTKKLSELFKEIEDLKKRHSIIEDYTVTETSLDEVFLSLARLHALIEATRYPY